MADTERLTLISNVAASYLRRNPVGLDQIESVIEHVSRAFEKAAIGPDIIATEQPQTDQVQATPVEEKRSPAVPIKKSVQREFVVCLEDGFKGRTLKKHLMVAHDLTPEQYREKWRLPSEHPIVAPAYSEQRSAMAKKLGLGQLGRGATRRKRAQRRKPGARG